MDRTATATLLTSLALCACTAVPNDALTAPSPQQFEALGVGEFPGANDLLDGFDDRGAETTWSNADAVLFGLRLAKGDTVDRWLLKLSVLPDDAEPGPVGGGGDATPAATRMEWNFTATIDGEKRKLPIRSLTRAVLVEVHDASGKPLGMSIVELPRDLMAQGLLPGIEAALRHQQLGGTFESFPSEDVVRPMAHGLVALVALLNVVQNDDVLQRYFWQVVQKPSLWSVIAGFGIEASLTASLEKSVPVASLPAPVPASTPAYAMPMRVDVNGTTALLADVLAVDPGSPFGLCAGIVAASARHPTQADLRFDVQLLAARRGRGR